ncbi:hypothetical protein niasHT_011127 [Heterodera trifolii]|uniref:Uncharacterized protein n=1 Tax=Heterodera trifolii TaxID=157864 RepID=A0ABD2L9C5_9BILA
MKLSISQTLAKGKASGSQRQNSPSGVLEENLGQWQRTTGGEGEEAPPPHAPHGTVPPALPPSSVPLLLAPPPPLAHSSIPLRPFTLIYFLS